MTELQSDRSGEIRKLLKQFCDPEMPLTERLMAIKALNVELPMQKVLQDMLQVFEEVKAAEGTEAYRDMAADLSLKTKAGQRVAAAVKKCVLDGLKPPKEAKPPKEKKPKEKKAPKSACVCGCGKLVHNFFASGHDAKVKGLLLNYSRGKAEASALPEALRKEPALLREFAQRWKIPTDTNGDIVVTLPPPKKVKAAKSSAPDGSAGGAAQ